MKGNALDVCRALDMLATYRLQLPITITISRSYLGSMEAQWCAEAASAPLEITDRP